MRAWKEIQDALATLDPSKIADGLSSEERFAILREGREARDWLDRVILAIEMEEAA